MGTNTANASRNRPVCALLELLVAPTAPLENLVCQSTRGGAGGPKRYRGPRWVRSCWSSPLIYWETLVRFIERPDNSLVKWIGQAVLPGLPKISSSNPTGSTTNEYMIRPRTLGVARAPEPPSSLANQSAKVVGHNSAGGPPRLSQGAPGAISNTEVA